jgi:hypothetical protein
MPDKTPQGRLAVSRPPGAGFSAKASGSSVVPCPGFPLRASIAVYLVFVVPTALDSSLVPCPGFPFGASIAVYPHRAVPTSGTIGASRVLRRFSSCMPRPVDSGGPSYPRHFGYFLCCLRCTLKPSASATTPFEAVPALQGARHPYGLQDTLSTLRPLCSPPLGDSATDARLDTGGWLTLARRGLSPRKKRRAWLGAITI